MDKRSDIWAFGCVLYEMLTGARVFDGDDVCGHAGRGTRGRRIGLCCQRRRSRRFADTAATLSRKGPAEAPCRHRYCNRPHRGNTESNDTRSSRAGLRSEGERRGPGTDRCSRVLGTARDGEVHPPARRADQYECLGHCWLDGGRRDLVLDAPRGSADRAVHDCPSRDGRVDDQRPRSPPRDHSGRHARVPHRQ